MSKTLWDVLYGTLWDMNIKDVKDQALMNCLILLKDYLVEMLENGEDEQ